MGNFLDQFKQKEPSVSKGDDKIALGVLLWILAEADGKILSQEYDKIKEILIKQMANRDVEVVMEAIKEAARQRVDIYQFTSEVSEKVSYLEKIEIIENLFRIGCVDSDLDDSEIETIRKISGLFHVAHKDFIEAKIRVKKEFGLDTAGL
ncbi:MAG: TerB family tellurite resistance protein [Candidatus Omnitrophica bacterium]|nr:TerB family tellurite resistance protein [Candidatus Omnitrophota bacterium]